MICYGVSIRASAYKMPDVERRGRKEKVHVTSFVYVTIHMHIFGVSTASRPDVDEEIDFLSSVINKQQISEVKPVMVSLCIIVGSMALIIAAVCWVRLQRETHLAEKVDYPAFHAAGPNHNHASSGDKTLAHSAQMYHYQHQKQQMLSMEKHKAEPKVSESGATSDEENEVGDFTVYECPGLAPTGEMEVKNPLFDDSTLHSQRNHK
ncbi:neural proliferation differentiation and control 1-like isoform X2 [Labeo rohita]|uniref:Neural proliferation differentiation and control 1-like isoform X2 n=1 Tax=Labeo rohita TaxID=84645 RepID=A0A498M0E6_LABRO|nr:neural proliferation differentiation and control 1-like isoform X2 [Labeo rohita]